MPYLDLELDGFPAESNSKIEIGKVRIISEVGDEGAALKFNATFKTTLAS